MRLPEVKRAVVTGASRGVALSLAGAGYGVFATGRGVEATPFPDSVHRIFCDQTVDAQTDQDFAQLDGLEVLVNLFFSHNRTQLHRCDHGTREGKTNGGVQSGKPSARTSASTCCAPARRKCVLIQSAV